jgi:hypothetical protein
LLAFDLYERNKLREIPALYPELSLDAFHFLGKKHVRTDEVQT